MAPCGAVDLLLPVGAGIAEHAGVVGAAIVVAHQTAVLHGVHRDVAVGILIIAHHHAFARVTFIYLGHGRTVLVAVHHVGELLLGAQRHATRIAHLRGTALAAFLGGDDDDTVRTTATVDGGGRCVLQHVERLNILGVDHRKGVGKALYAVVVHRHAVDDDQRVVGGIQRRASTNADGSAATRGTAAAGDADTGNLTLHHVLGVDHEALVLRVGLQGRHRSGQVALLHSAVTDDHHVLQHRLVVLECNCQSGGGLHRLRLIADVAHGDVGTLVGFQHEVTVEVGDGGRLCAGHAHRSSDNGFACSIFHKASHLNLGEGSYR